MNTTAETPTAFVLYRNGKRVSTHETLEDAETAAQEAYEDEKYDYPSEGVWLRNRSYWAVEEEAV